MAQDQRFTFFQRPYADIAEALPEGVVLDGVMMDIGVSSPQIDDISRGFSLQNLAYGEDRPLDLRMNPSTGLSASEWLEGASVEEVAWVLEKYGDDFDLSLQAERLAEAIIADQEANGPYTSMKRFAEVVGRAKLMEGEEFEHPIMGLDHPAKLTVQALRLFINQEMEQLESGLAAVFSRLAFGGRVITSAFKRKEGQVIRQFVMEHEEPRPGTAKLSAKRRRELYPLVGTDLDYTVRLLSKPMRPSNAEVGKNTRARSGALYIMEKAPRTGRQVKAKPRQVAKRLKEPSRPVLSG